MQKNKSFKMTCILTVFSLLFTVICVIIIFTLLNNYKNNHSYNISENDFPLELGSSLNSDIFCGVSFEETLVKENKGYLAAELYVTNNLTYDVKALFSDSHYEDASIEYYVYYKGIAPETLTPKEKRNLGTAIFVYDKNSISEDEVRSYIQASEWNVQLCVYYQDKEYKLDYKLTF